MPGPDAVLSQSPAERRRVIVIGDVTTDIITMLDQPVAVGSDTAVRIRISGGGQAANTAGWLAWHNHPVTLLASVGDDTFGHCRLAELRALGVDCAFHWCPGVPTGMVIVLSNGSERSMLSERGANMRLPVSHVDALITGLPDAAHVHLSGYVLLDDGSRPAGLRALAAARDRGLTISVDAASAQPLRAAGIGRCLSWLDGVDLLLANEDEAAVLTGGMPAEGAACALTAVARNVVVKRGAAGAVWAGRNGVRLSSPARPAAAVDTTGAGDAFAAGLLSALLEGCDQASALDRAIDFGAAAATGIGGGPPGPPIGEVR